MKLRQDSLPIRKKWGQNFLKDPNITRKIVAELELQNGDSVFEIGPGRGALTREFDKLDIQYSACEIDPKLAELLRKDFPNVQVHLGDILGFDFSSLHIGTKIVGNLPYNISSQILFKLLEFDGWAFAVFMLQREMAERVIATHGSKRYGRISVMLQSVANIRMAFRVPATVFHPRPEVESAVLCLEPRSFSNTNRLAEICKRAFSQRRKQLRNTIPDIVKNHPELQTKRPEEISVETFQQLAKE